jgi:ribosomal protein S18 acetylase RimI-like enzyme
LTAATIRAAGPADAERLSLVGRATFLETFAGLLDEDAILGHCRVKHAPEVYAGWLADGESRLWLAEASEGRAPVGYAVLTAPDLPEAGSQEGDIEIRRIYLLSRFQGGGTGRALMEAALAAAREAGRRRVVLGAYRENPVVAFYERFGFQVIGERKFQVGPRTYDDVVLALTL